MSSLYRKKYLALLTTLLLITLSCSLTAQDCCNRFYIGAFGGGIYSNSSEADQYGTAFFSELESIGPLPIIAKGHLNKTSAGFGGVQIGYEWSQPLCSGWSLAPAGELEAFFFSQNKKGHLINETVIGLPEHDFFDSFHLNSSVILANLVVSVNNHCLCGFAPYVGGGIGPIRLSLSHADSTQVVPVEAGVNHFNSDPNDSYWTFAAQVKAGLGYQFCRFQIFGEYRYLYVDASRYVFGSTNYPTHVPTSPWNVKLHNMQYNAFVFGIQYNL